MRYRFYICLFGILLGTCVELRADPVPLKNVVFKPTFVTADTPITAGTAFLCEYPERANVVLMTAHHLLGHAGGFPAELPWDHLNEMIKATTAVSMDDPGISVKCGRAILIEGAHASDKSGLQNDIAVFEVDSVAALPALKLAKVPPAPGDRVWLYGRQRGGTVLELFPGTVGRSTDTELLFVYDKSDIHLAGTSGAPILNSAGEVVAINIGGNERAGKTMGFGNPVSSIRNHLHRAAEGKP
jgi:hypothetical protein